MIVFDSPSSTIVSNHNKTKQSKPYFEAYRTIRKSKQIRSPSAIIIKPHTLLVLVSIVTNMFLNRCCYGDISGVLHRRSAYRYKSMMGSQNLNRSRSLLSCGKGVTTDPPQRRQNRLIACDEIRRPYCSMYRGQSLALPPSRRTTSFILSAPQSHQQQQQSFASTQTKTPRSANRWRSPILRPPVTPPDSKRPPKLYKRLHNIRGKKNSNDDDVSAITDDGKLYRADRVLANRTGKSRKECFQLLQERRVFIVTDQLYHEVSPKQLRNGISDKNPASTLDDCSSATGTDVDNIGTEDASNRNSKNIVAQYRLEVITGPAMKIGMHTKLRIDKYQDVPLPPPLLMIYHKPKWVLSVRRDPIGRPCLDDVLLGSSADSTTNPSAVPPLHPVGRLDYDTTGLLLFSSSGPLTQALLHPKHSIEKEYVAVVSGIVNEEELRTTLASGVTTGEGVHTAQLVSALPNIPSAEDAADFLAKVKSGLPNEYNTTDLKLRGYLDIFDATSLSTVTLTVSEGKHRMVRRMLANVGHPVVTLHRARLGEISLGDVPVGQTRALTPTEMKWAQKQLKQGSKVLNPTESKKNTAQSYDSDEDIMQ